MSNRPHSTEDRPRPCCSAHALLHAPRYLHRVSDRCRLSTASLLHALLNRSGPSSTSQSTGTHLSDPWPSPCVQLRRSIRARVRGLAAAPLGRRAVCRGAGPAIGSSWSGDRIGRRRPLALKPSWVDRPAASGSGSAGRSVQGRALRARTCAVAAQLSLIPSWRVTGGRWEASPRLAPLSRPGMPPGSHTRLVPRSRGGHDCPGRLEAWRNEAHLARTVILATAPGFDPDRPPSTANDPRPCQVWLPA